MIDTVRISGPAKDQLITLKRRTGVKHWNELGRWALCRSLAEPSAPPDATFAGEGAIDIDWRTFTGAAGDLYLDLVLARCRRDGLMVDDSVVRRQLHLHLHRGIGYLVGDPRLGRAAEGGGQRRATGVRELLVMAAERNANAA